MKVDLIQNSATQTATTGAVDYVVPPEAIAPLLENIAARYRKAKGAEA